MAGFDPFEDDEIVLDGDINDREVAVKEEKKRAKDWLDKRTTQTNAYIAALDKEIADRKAGKPSTEVRFRFENLERGGKKPRPSSHGSSKLSVQERIENWAEDNRWRIAGVILSLVLALIATNVLAGIFPAITGWAWTGTFAVAWFILWLIFVAGIGQKLDESDVRLRKPKQ